MDKNEKVRRALSLFRRRQTLFVIIYAAVNSLITVGIIVYYKLKEQALVGEYYLIDRNGSRTLVGEMFNNNLSRDRIIAGKSAMVDAGFGSHGFSYLNRISGEIYIFMGIAAVIMIVLVMALIWCYRLGKHGFMADIISVSDENDKLKNQLENEQEYNKQQYQKMHDFIENIAHQIKTPLAVITMKLEMLQADSSQAALISDCTGNAFRIKAFIKELLDISRFEAGKVIIARDEIEAASLIEESINSSSVDREIVITNYGKKSLHMYADEGWLMESFINLIDNSGSYVKDSVDGRIYIDVDRCEDDCIITIADNGVGLNDEVFNNIFNRFETEGKAQDFRAGIGLNLSKLIVEAHHGTIKAGNSERYGGAEFVVTLPMYKLKTKY